MRALIPCASLAIGLALIAQTTAAHEPLHQHGVHCSQEDPVGCDGRPLAGFQGGVLYLRNPADTMRLFIGGYAHIDSLNYAGTGVSDTDLKSTVILRRARVQLAGEFLRTWVFTVQAELGPTAFQNPTGTQQTSVAPAGVAPGASTQQYATVQAASTRAVIADAYIIYRPTPLFNLQLGQFLVPFTMENRTSPNALTFMERSMAVRVLAAPQDRDIGIMGYGALDRRLLYYSAGVFLGDGTNRPNADNRFDTMARWYVRPLALTRDPFRDFQVGMSFRFGMRDPHRVAYDASAMTTQSGYAFWSPTYSDSHIDPATGAGRLTHIIPAGQQRGVAAELRVPVSRFELRGEAVYVNNQMREGVDGFQTQYTERFGTFSGWSYYAQFSCWIWGKPRYLSDPGETGPQQLDFSKPIETVPAQGVEVALRWEELHANYKSSNRVGTPDSRNIDGDIHVNSVAAGINYWATRHMRLSLNYLAYFFPDSAPKSASEPGGPMWDSSQRALAPGNQLAKGVDNNARDSAHTLHEIAARAQFSF